MPVRLYVETNLILAAAKGQDRDGMELLSVPRPDVELAMPSVCLMEALGSFESDLRHRNQLRGQLEGWLREVRRDVTALRPTKLMESLGTAVIEHDELTASFRKRFELAMRLSVVRTRLLPTEASAALLALDDVAAGSRDLTDRTDKLIFCTVFHDALSRPDARLAFLSADEHFHIQSVVSGFAAVGVTKLFKTAAQFLGWYSALTPPPPAPPPTPGPDAAGSPGA